MTWRLTLSALAPDEEDAPLTAHERAELDDLYQLALDERDHGE